MRQTIPHTLAPIWDSESRVLVLGSLPSPLSRQEGFYYANPRNRFWTVLGAVFEEKILPDSAAREAFLHRQHIALWDVIASCSIEGASDASIREVVANDLTPLLEGSQISTIFTTGKTADRYYRQLLAPKTGMLSVCLPSPSPANCAVSLPALVAAYQPLRSAARIDSR